jgi:endogenous inhibitor of DNA gyrase (YacG/DUF329 family)
MSRGPGRVQRKIISMLAPDQPYTRYREAYSTRELARSIYHGRPSEAQMSAVRRALRSLIAAGRVEVRPVPALLADDGPEAVRYCLTAAADRSVRRALRQRRSTAREPALARAPEARPGVLDVDYTAPCPACGQPAEWNDHWDRRKFAAVLTVRCPSCSLVKRSEKRDT